MTRSIAFYRSQQEGNAPVRVLLTGASAQLPYMQNFFEEKLQVEVDFLNPFQTVGYPSHIDAEQFGRDAFSLPALVGLALRRGLSCPVEINSSIIPRRLSGSTLFAARTSAATPVPSLRSPIRICSVPI